MSVCMCVYIYMWIVHGKISKKGLVSTYHRFIDEGFGKLWSESFPSWCLDRSTTTTRPCSFGEVQMTNFEKNDDYPAGFLGVLPVPHAFKQNPDHCSTVLGWFSPISRINWFCQRFLNLEIPRITIMFHIKLAILGYTPWNKPGAQARAWRSNANGLGPWFNRTRLWMNFVRILRPYRGFQSTAMCLDLGSKISFPVWDTHPTWQDPKWMEKLAPSHDLFKEVRSTQQFGCNQSLHVVSGRLFLPQPQLLLLVMIVANHIEIAWYGWGPDPCPIPPGYVSTWKESIQTAVLKVGELEPS